MNQNYLKVFILATVAILLTSLSASASEMDDRIVSSAKQSYVFKTYLKDDAINVQSKDGVVTLTGTVTEDSHKSLAKETVSGLPGVKSADDQLQVTGERPAENSDIWISMQVKGSLLYNRNVSGINTKVYVTDGVVTLQGAAENTAQIDLATEYAKDINGVKGVKNEMTVAVTPSEPKKTIGEKIDDASVAAQVKMALLVHHSTNAFKTGVEAINGVVTLTGKATSGAGKNMATKIASDVGGVTNVVNKMTIEETSSKN